MSEEAYKAERTKIHCAYWLGIAAMLMIGQATHYWGNDEKFTMYLSNAATMTSLFLALVAIIYAFYSNASLSQSLGGISQVSTEVRQSRDFISQYLEQTKEVAHEGQTQVDTLKAMSHKLELDLSKIASQHSAIQNLLTEIPGRFDSLESTLKTEAVKPSRAVAGRKAASEHRPPEHLMRTFMEQSSIAGLFLCYAMTISKQRGTPMRIVNVNTTPRPNMAQYLKGYAVSMAAANFIDYDDDDKLINVEYVHPYINENVLKIIDERIAGAKGNAKQRLNQWKAHVENEDLALDPESAES